MPFLDGAYITQWRDPERTRDSFARISKKDGDTYWRMLKESENIKPTEKFWQRRLAMSHWDIIRDEFRGRSLPLPSCWRARGRSSRRSFR